MTHSRYVRRRMTADEFLALPPDHGRTQLIDGEIVVNDPTTRHQAIVGRLVQVLLNWTDEHPGAGTAGIGCNWRMPNGDAVVPDAWFVRPDRLPPGNLTAYDGAPDLVVEVRSPRTWRSDRGRKKDAYLALGAEVWLVDTVADEVLVFRCDDGAVVKRGQTLSTPLLPGLAIDAGALFDR